MLRRAWQLRSVRPLIFLLTTIGGAAIFFFGAGEEISWGQRIFGVETPEWMEEHNRQKEMNLHNLVIGGVNINKLVFSKILGVFLLFYLLIIPALYRKKEGFAKLIDRIGIPLPKPVHVVLWIAVILITEYIVGTPKRGELREFLLASLLLAQLIRPLNGWIYDKEKRRS